ncbi:MAG: coproporphyrinogen III oxidase [Alphaproteobacteria bacterium]|nr:MAG: coproporphyrinogen III oxidase [Alphaproteobacteria bacterium]
MNAATESADLALYIHWPFCLSKCPYCDFNSHAMRGEVEETRWAKALLAEMGFEAARLPGRRLTSIFMGGGTPSLMSPAMIARLIEAACGFWPPASELEITLEANPATVETARLADFRTAGVNRLSLGVQSLDDEALRFLGRRHDAAQARAAMAQAARIFPRFSFDLIYAYAGHDPARWRDQLTEAAQMAQGGHISAYSLTIEPGTAFATQTQRGAVLTTDEDTGAVLYDITQDVLEAAGMPAYEVSNHARPGQECRHNLTYWRYGEYAGIGPGAHGRLDLPQGRAATLRRRSPAVWLDQVERDGHGTEDSTFLDIQDQREEALLMGLRLGEGLSSALWEKRFGTPLLGAFDSHALERLIRGEFVVRDHQGLRTTAKGRRVLGAVLSALA